MIRFALVLAALLAPVALPGCLCEPLLEVRHCREDQKHCSPDAADVRAWAADDANQFPEVQTLLDALEVGTHGHVDYNAVEEQAFWDYWGLDNSNHDQQVFVSYNDAIYRLRVYTCEGDAL